ncbi:MAG: methyltransferase [Mariprofundaceae bacterium]|nr:methyltransferase [Mariprofundaceae bacterium]
MSDKTAGLLYSKGLELALSWSSTHGRKPHIALINGICHAELKALGEFSADLIVQQQRRDECLNLQRAGYTITRQIRHGDFDVVLVLAGRQREQTLGWLAEGAKLLGDDGRDGYLALCAANSMGAKGYETRLKALACVRVISKSKCRFSLISGRDITDSRLLDEWLAAAAPRMLPDSGLISCPGVFSWDRPDAGSRLLLDYLPENLAGRGMDLGCGNGFLSRHVLENFTAIREWHAVDVDATALHCAQQNLRDFSDAHADIHICTHWLDATREALPGGLDVVLMNPPFHKDRADCVALGQAMIKAAMCSLKPAGRLLLVANRHLPYELALYQGFDRVQTLFEGDGYKVMQCDGVV